ncbi:glycerate kinase [Humibacter ginsenosidimutans]|uniref:Glycerate kinase n=1 Tax=Humibacter ginsenosidimutans TaxID=2599293 RepID=A0A5B8M7R2_9MICO|nr:glycerate kinase [Humibacter ginsenosidimutans]QDZ16239.1 glycerate kinase [Humibacter ginsenosidimutans]
MRIVIAPDSFKGSASAVRVCEALAAGWREVRPDDELVELPMADGGEGTLDAFLLAVPGANRMPVRVTGPDGRVVQASWVLLPPTPELPGGTGVVELAETSGLPLMARLDAMNAHTLGFGQAIAAAIDHGVSRLLLGIGGSASTDGGGGVLVALGARLLDAEGLSVLLGGGSLPEVATIDVSRLRSLPEGGALVLSDVTNPLLGASGAADVFGEQKGADAAQRADLEAALASWSRVLSAAGVAADPAAPGAGAAGGTGFGLMAWGARLVSGASAIADAIGLDAALADADLVITGEGRFDAQTDGGKAPAIVAEHARAAHAPIALVAGSLAAEPHGFVSAFALTDLAGSAGAALADAPRWLRAAGEALAVREGHGPE